VCLPVRGRVLGGGGRLRSHGGSPGDNPAALGAGVRQRDLQLSQRQEGALAGGEHRGGARHPAPAVRRAADVGHRRAGGHGGGGAHDGARGRDGRCGCSGGRGCGPAAGRRRAPRRALEAAGRVAAATGARVFADRFSARTAQGRGRFAPRRIPYFPEAAEPLLAGLGDLILVEAQPPVSFFAYPGRRSTLAPEDCAMHTLARSEEDGTAALEALAEVCGAPPFAAPAPVEPPPLPRGAALTPETVGMAVAALLPEGAIVSDEAQVRVLLGPPEKQRTYGFPLAPFCPHRPDCAHFCALAPAKMCLTGGFLDIDLPVPVRFCGDRGEGFSLCLGRYGRSG
jgi:hypothetical protein